MNMNTILIKLVMLIGLTACTKASTITCTGKQNGTELIMRNLVPVTLEKTHEKNPKIPLASHRRLEEENGNEIQGEIIGFIVCTTAAIVTGVDKVVAVPWICMAVAIICFLSCVGKCIRACLTTPS